MSEHTEPPPSNVVHVLRAETPRWRRGPLVEPMGDMFTMVAVPRWSWNHIIARIISSAVVCPRGHWMLVTDVGEHALESRIVKGRLTRKAMHRQLDAWLDEITELYGDKTDQVT